ncbi:MAG: class I SAM-dependent methyltransferase [Lachnospiraceae bacterium]|nr:class I SAM-dependent methyltransferase [Lachnospiraceae bacterium]
MKPYASFSTIYDRCMDNVPYDEWALRLVGILRESGVPDGGIVADLGCGTGKMSRRLRDAGYDVIGLDASEEMLMVAQDREYERLADLCGSEDEESGDEEFDDSGRITYLCQDVRSFELYGTTAAMVSVCDTLNYLTTEDELAETFRLVNNYLDKDGVFCFDMKTPRYYEKVLGNGVRVEDYDDSTLIWDNAYDAENGLNEYRLTIFLREGDGPEEDRYVRSDETHVQRAYSLETIKELLAQSGMTFVAAYDGYTKEPATETTERFVIVAKEGFQSNKYYG